MSLRLVGPAPWSSRCQPGASWLDQVQAACALRDERHGGPRLLLRDVGQTLVQSRAHLGGVVLTVGAAPARDDHARGRHTGEARDADELPRHPHGHVV